MTDPHHHDLLREVTAALTRTFGRRVEIGMVEELPSPHTVLRCFLEGAALDPASVIVKQVTTTEFTSSDGALSTRFLNEWAALEFAGTVSSGTAPRLLAAGAEPPLIVLEDLGSAPRVLDVLQGVDTADATVALEKMGRALGDLHAASRGEQERFSAIQRRVGAESPRSDSTVDLRLRLGELGGVFGDPAPATLGRLVESLEADLHDQSAWRTFLHADAGPQNVLLGDERAVFIDFEFAAFGHCLLDAVSARLGFPHSARAASVPSEATAAFETAYRSRLAEAIPQAADDHLFDVALADAAAHWALVRLGGLWGRLFTEPDTGEAAVRTQRSQVVTVVRGFLDLAERTGRRRELADLCATVLSDLSGRFSGVEVMPTFPAFSSR